MKTIAKFFEQLATTPHFSDKTNSIIEEQSQELRDAFVVKNSSVLREKLSDKSYLPDGLQVIRE